MITRSRRSAPVTGKTLLHLQCHFGIDSLSWARLRATVTGIDFSERAIELAAGLAAELRLDASFIRSDVYELPTQLSGDFDVVYTSRGALCWLPRIRPLGGRRGPFRQAGRVPLRDRQWWMPDELDGTMPLMYSLKATKPA